MERAGKGNPAREVHEAMLHGPGGTGKSRGILMFLWWLMDNHRVLWPQAEKNLRILMCRETRVSLSQSGLTTWEEAVVPAGHPILEGAGKAQRQSYVHPGTGAELVLAGMDEPTRLFSTDYDIVYIQEATEITEHAWESLRRGLRNWALPFQLLVGDCNPDSPRHWLRRRMLDGRTLDLKSEHWDNPRWWAMREDGTWSWTPEGEAYRDSLNKLTGVRRRRLFLGEWVSAEGAVWEEFDEQVHIVEEAPTPRWTIASIDWGYTAPGVLQVWGVDAENRACCLSEHYRVGQQIEWWAEMLGKEWREHRLQFAVADPSRPDAIKLVNDILASRNMPRLVREANNRRAEQGADLGGIDLVRKKLLPQADGKPALTWKKGYLVSRDPELHDKGEACCTTEEIPSYVYAKVEDGKRNKERTDPAAADHGCFPASVLVLTEHGPKFIDRIKVGTRVWTPHGLRKVVGAAQTSENAPIRKIVLENGLALSGTPDHPVWVNGEWTRLDSVRSGDIVSVWGHERRFWTGSAPLRRSGMLLRPDMLGTRPTTKRRKRACTCEKSGAVLTATLDSWRSSELGEDFAERVASRLTGVSLDSTENIVCASCAEEVSSLTATTKPCVVPLRVEHATHGQNAAVYNLTVEGEHCFFANWILVHNCDALRYAVRAIWNKDYSEPERRSSFAEGSYGKLLGHDEVWRQIGKGRYLGKHGY